MIMNKNNNFQKATYFWLTNGISILSLLIILIGILSIFITAYFNTTFYHPDEMTYFKFSIGIIEIVTTVIVSALILFISRKILKKIPSNVLIVLLLIASCLLFIFWVKTIKLNHSCFVRLHIVCR